MAVSLLLSAKNNVTVYDIDEDRVRMLNEGKTTVRDPEAEKAAKEVLSIPMFPEITEEQVRRVCETIRAFYEKDATI